MQSFSCGHVIDIELLLVYHAILSTPHKHSSYRISEHSALDWPVPNYPFFLEVVASVTTSCKLHMHLIQICSPSMEGAWHFPHLHKMLQMMILCNVTCYYWCHGRFFYISLSCFFGHKSLTMAGHHTFNIPFHIENKPLKQSMGC